MEAVFQTYDGCIIYRSKNRMYSAGHALKKAAVLGFDTLLAVEPDGTTYDYTDLLRRDYLPTLQMAA